MIRREAIIIGLTPTMLRVGTVSGGALSSINCTPLDPGEWDQTWEKNLTPLDAALRSAVEALSIRTGTPARVFYVAPKAGAEVFSVPAQGPAAQRAAEMSLRESLQDKSGSCPIAVHPLHRDAAIEGVEQSRTHILGVSDTVAGSNTLAAWLRRANLTLDSLIPAKAAALASVTQTATSLPTEGTHAVLWMGDHVTALAGWSNGRLLFSRAIDFGYWMLADAIFRAVRAQGNPTFDRLSAYQMLFRSGVPRRGQQVDADLKLSAEQVLPFMQPVLQRYVVETRQTLRFGIPESELSRTVLRFAGPGGRICDFASTLENQLDVTIDRAEASGPADEGFVARGELAEFSPLNTADFCLLPPAEADRRMSQKLNSALRVGAMAAVLVLAAIGGWTYGRTANTAKEIRGLEARTDAMNKHAILRAQADKLATDMSTATKSIKEMLGSRTRWMAGLAMVSKACGEFIDLNHVAGSYPQENKGAPTLTLSGTAWPMPGGHSARSDSLSAFLDRLAGSPLVASASIVSTHADVNGGDAKTFVISVTLKSVGPEGSFAEAFSPSRAPERTTAQVQEQTP